MIERNETVYVTITGVQGTGKSTTAGMLIAALNARRDRGSWTPHAVRVVEFADGLAVPAVTMWTRAEGGEYEGG